MGRLQELLGIPGSTLSHHIARLVRVGLVSQERRSRVLICRAEYARMDALLGFLGEECCQGLATNGDSAGEGGNLDCSLDCTEEGSVDRSPESGTEPMAAENPADPSPTNGDTSGSELA